jgi:outer membrane lipoprotein carrier protein
MKSSMRQGSGLRPSVLIAGALCSLAAAASPLSQVEQQLAGLSAWSADFTQTISDGQADSQAKPTRTAAGKFYLQRPGRFRWDYVQPSEQLIVTDGKKLWFYDKDLSQANVRDLDSTLASTPAMLLSGTGSIGSEFDVTALPAADGLQWYQLKPKRNDSDFLAVRIAFRGDQLARMLLADKLNQVTRLDFSNQKRNMSLAPELFNFVPPAGVDVIGRSGAAP